MRETRYNSTVIASLVQNSYAYLIVKEDFLNAAFTDAAVNSLPSLYKEMKTYESWEAEPLKSLPALVGSLSSAYRDRPNDFVRTTVLDGLRAYRLEFTQRPNLLAVAAGGQSCVKPPCHDPTLNGTLLSYGIPVPHRHPGCGGLCEELVPSEDASAAKKYDRCPDLQLWDEERAKEWNMRGFNISYFLIDRHIDASAEITKRYQKCHLQCVPAFLLGKRRYWLLSKHVADRNSGHSLQCHQMCMHLMGHLVLRGSNNVHVGRRHRFFSGRSRRMHRGFGSSE
jgi:hypothetical protein